MRTKLRWMILLFTITNSMTFAQIPNPGFENWNNFGTFMEANGWNSTNLLSTGNFYAITRSTDHYPAAIGTYSIRIENNTAVLPSLHALGFVWTLPLTATEPEPSFPVSGHPNSLTGYYKYIPQNNDTLHIEAQLYLNGSWVSNAKMTSNANTPNWTSFSIPFSSYTTADSGIILLGAYNVEGITTVPHGNSVLYVDNLNFDNLITSVDEMDMQNNISMYPNPAIDEITVANTETTSDEIIVKLYNVFGQEILSQAFSGESTTLDVTKLAEGTYFVMAIADDQPIFSKKVIIMK